MTIIQHRRGTAAEWTSANPILNSGELGFETDTGKSKVGDGTTNWNTLPYSLGSGGPAPVNVVADAGAATTIPVTHDMHDVTMTQDCTFTFDNPARDGFVFVLVLRGAFVPTFPASVDWADATPPTYSPVAQYTFSTNDGGTTWLGTLVGGGYA